MGCFPSWQAFRTGSQAVYPDTDFDTAGQAAQNSLDAMVSWNCSHLSNENNRRYLKGLTLAEGYPFGFDIITPEKAIIYD